MIIHYCCAYVWLKVYKQFNWRNFLAFKRHKMTICEAHVFLFSRRRPHGALEVLESLGYTFGFMKTAPLAMASNGAGPSYGNPRPTNIYIRISRAFQLIYPVKYWIQNSGNNLQLEVHHLPSTAVAHPSKHRVPRFHDFLQSRASLLFRIASKKTFENWREKQGNHNRSRDFIW